MPMSTVLSKNKELTATTAKKRDGLLKTCWYNTFMIDMAIALKINLIENVLINNIKIVLTRLL